jgi:hypothetical protein
VLIDDDKVSTYFAPDLDVLLAPEFLEDHCLRLTQGARADEIGVSFEPILTRRVIPEIRGTLWLDRQSSGLKRLEYWYVNIPTIRAEQADGSMQFAVMSNGAWAITRWEIRMPVPYQAAPREPWRVAELRSTGGELIVARRGNDTLWRRPAMTVEGHVVDSASGRSVGAATVALAGTTQRASTDARGAFAIPDVLPGEYTLEVRTPSLDSVRAVHQVKQTISESVGMLRIAVPTAVQVTSAVCGVRSGNGPARSPGAILGTLRVPGETSAAANVRIAADWTERTTLGGRIDVRRRRMETFSDRAGNWRICGVPTEQLIAVRALPVGGRANSVNVRLEPDQLFRRVDLTIDVASAPVATFIGVVVTADSTPLPVLDAEVLLPDLAMSSRTNARGEFRLDDVPSGEHRVVVRRLGFGALDVRLRFASNELEERRIVLSRITVLDSVSVRADNVIPSFEDHRRVGLGHFLNREELSGMENRSLAAVLANFSNTKFIHGKSGQVWLARARGPQSLSGSELKGPGGFEQGAKPGCYAHVYLDNLPMYVGRGEPLFNLRTLSPDRIEAIEYYASAAQTPSEYSRLGATCGVLVIWSRRTHAKP